MLRSPGILKFLRRLPLGTPDQVTVLLDALVDEAQRAAENRELLAQVLCDLCREPWQWDGRLVMTRRLLKRAVMTACQTRFDQDLRRGASVAGIMELMAYFFNADLIPFAILASMLDDVASAQEQRGQRRREAEGFFRILRGKGRDLDAYTELDALLPP
jgi:hypothetical protein